MRLVFRRAGIGIAVLAAMTGLHADPVAAQGRAAQVEVDAVIEEPLSQKSSSGFDWSFYNISFLLGIVVFLCGGYWSGSIWSVFAPSTGQPGSLTNAKHTPIPAVLLPPLESDAGQDSEV